MENLIFKNLVKFKILVPQKINLDGWIWINLKQKINGLKTKMNFICLMDQYLEKNFNRNMNMI